MKKFIIECEHNIYVDSHSEGETENVNNFDTKGTYKAEEPAEAIKQHLSSLGYNFKPEFMQLDEEEENQNKIWYSVLCDVENNEATKNQKCYSGYQVVIHASKYILLL